MPKLPTAPANRLLPALRRVVLVRESADRTDGQLLTAFLHDRDGDAFAVLVRRHGPMVLGVARRVIGDFHTADDAFQAVFLVLARRANAVRPREQVGNWLYGVAYRTAIKARMVLARRRSREKQVDAMPETVQLPPDSWSDLQPVIDAELARLPDKLRLPVVLCDLEGRPQRSVAKHLGIAPATLAARVAAARRLLAERLGKRGISLSGGALAVVLGERAAAAHVAPMLAESAVRAAEAVAAGGAATGFVSAYALQLSEGVMRMMMLAKLKAAVAAVLVAFAVIGGFGIQQAFAGEPQAQSAPANPVAVRSAAPNPDDEFLRRIMLDLTGTLPTRLEHLLFRADADANKRAKVIDWLIADDRVKANLAKRLGIPPERIAIARSDQAISVTVRPEGMSFADFDSNGFLDLDADGFPDLLIAAQDRRQRWTNLAVTVDRSMSATENATATFVRSRPKSTALLFESSDANRVNLNAVWAQKYSGLATVPANGSTLTYLDEVYEQPAKLEIVYWVTALDPESQRKADIEFLKQAVQAARGSAPTPLEERYFTEDKDPKKRERLLDELLKDPATAKKLGEAWKKKMLEAPTGAKWTTLRENAPWYVPPDLTQPQGFRVQLVPHVIETQKPSKMEMLVDSLIAAKKTDEQILEAVTLAAASRLPTAEEKKATLAVIGTLADKKAAWVAIGKTLAPAK